MAKNGWKLIKIAITGSTLSLLVKNGRKWVFANQIWSTRLFAAIVFRYTRFWPMNHQELPFLAIALELLNTGNIGVSLFLGTCYIFFRKCWDFLRIFFFFFYTLF